MLGSKLLNFYRSNFSLLKLFGLVAVLCLIVYAWLGLQLSITIPSASTNVRPGSSASDSDGPSTLTVRVNTFRRLDLLEISLSHYTSCPVVKEIQVIWSDPQNKPPLSWLKSRFESRVAFEVHNTNSLSNRFLAKLPVTTDAVLSIDDDLAIPCEVLEDAMGVWRSFDRALVGFSPRLHSFDVYTGRTKYLRWQHSWWSGIYSIMLTKASLLHKDYLDAYPRLVPQSFLAYIDSVRNCEDIAMAYVVATLTRAAPVWVEGIVYETSSSGISSGKDHFAQRGECLSVLRNATGSWPWVVGYQKVVPIGWLDAFRLWQFDL